MELRRLSTIIFADIAGYTALMQSDEKTGLVFLQQFKEILEDHTAKTKGKIVQYYGDGCLLAFDSSVDGVTCAMAIQKAFMAKDIPVRIGIHLGEVVFRDDNAFGDGVNIASRIESAGVPGAILLSSAVRDQIKNKMDFEVRLLGAIDFKNVEAPIDVYVIANDGFTIPNKKHLQGKLKEKRKANQKVKWGILTVLAVILVTSWALFKNPYSEEPSETVIPKLAILEFSNRGIPQVADLNSSITRELNLKLSGLKKLAVISKSSTDVYSGADKTVEEIGKELNVDYILEGSVEWDTQADGTSIVHVRPRLRKVADNTEVWTGDFRAALDKRQTIQADITSALLFNLNVAISDEEKRQLETTLTSNHLAYEAYLKGIKVKPQSHGAENDFRIAYQMFQQAIALDPNFSGAWLGLGEVYKDLYWYGYNTQPATLDSALVCIQKARKLAPKDPMVTLSLGDYYYRKREYDRSLQEFSKVMDERPNDPKLLQQISELWRRQGLFEQAIETMEKGLKLDPFNVNTITELSWTYIFTGNFERALELNALSRRYNPDSEWNYMMGALIHWSRNGPNDLEAAGELLDNFPDPQSEYPANFRLLQYTFENKPEKILRLLDTYPLPAIGLQDSYSPVALIRGYALKQLGEVEEAKLQFDLARIQLENEVTNNPTDFRMRIALGMAYAHLGEKEKAIASGMEATRMMPLENDHLLGLDVLFGLMRIYALTGENEKAFDVMAKLFSVPCHIRGLFFTGLPDFEQIRTTNRFQDLLEVQRKMNLKFNNSLVSH